LIYLYFSLQFYFGLGSLDEAGRDVDGDGDGDGDFDPGPRRKHNRIGARAFA